MSQSEGNTATLSPRESRPVLVLVPCNQPTRDKSVGNAALDRIFAMLGAKRKGIIA